MENGSGRPRTSCGLLEWYLSIGDGIGGVAKRCSDILEFEWWQFGDDLFCGHCVGEHAEDGCDGDPQSADARDAAHLVWIYCNAIHEADAT